MVKLNVGAGRNILKDYQNVDLYHPRADVTAPAWDLPYGDETVAEIYCSHMMEHLRVGEPNQLDLTLKEFYRVLVPLGILEMITPDLEKAIKYWLNTNENTRWDYAHKRIFGYQRNDGEIHYTGFTAIRWESLLPHYGFKILELRNQPNRFKRDEQHIKNSDLYVRAQKR